MFQKFIFFCFALALIGCAGTPPIFIYNQAQLALEKAKAENSSTYAPKSLKISERYYNLAKKYYNQRKYNESKKQLLKAIKWAEKAESISVLRKEREKHLNKGL